VHQHRDDRQRRRKFFPDWRIAKKLSGYSQFELAGWVPREFPLF
jgi:hypothetical protein